jgi:hypothetical protein
MAVVLATDKYATVREVVERFRAQTIHDRLELILVVPAGEAAATEAVDPSGFARFRVVAVESVVPLAASRAAGVLAATAPLVFLGETHSYPHTRLAETLVEAHAAAPTVVVPAFRNANPEAALSWAAFLSDYGGWADGLPAGEPDIVPTYNAAYQRSFLIELGERLPLALGQSHEMQAQLRRNGGRVVFEPAARMDHANISRFRPWLRQRYVVGRVLAANRSRSWSGLRRLAYACGAPLVPLVLLARRQEAVRVTRRRERVPAGTIPALVLDTLVKATGELVGYARGAPPSLHERLDHYEVHKIAYTGRSELSELAPSLVPES